MTADPAPKRVKTSPLWRLFTPIENNKARCDICKHKLSCKSTITNLRKHLIRKHPFINLSDFTNVAESLKKVKEKLMAVDPVLNDINHEVTELERREDLDRNTQQEIGNEKITKTIQEIDTTEFIKTYKLNPALWDVKCSLYIDPVKKSEAYEKIAEKFNVTSDDVKWKINELHRQFKNELNSMLEKQSVTNTEPYKSKWLYFESLMFLIKPPVRRQSVGSAVTLDEETYESTIEGAVEVEDLNEVGNLRFRKRSSSSMQEIENLLGLPKRSVPDHHYDIFGAYVTSTLKNISAAHLKRKLERRIQQVILEIKEEEESALAPVNPNTTSGTIRVVPSENLFSYVGFVPE